MRTGWKVLIGLLLVVVALLYYAYSKFLLGDASAASDIVIDEWSSDEIEGIPVALDITPAGDVYVAETGQFSEGVGDNRAQSFWFMDDMASTSVEDRLAYVKKALSNGDLEEEWFNAKDTLRLVRDSDQNGEADSSIVVAQTGGYVDGVMAGVLATDDGVLVTNIPKLYRFKDNNGDFKADVTEVLSSGYGIRTAFVGHDLHGLTWGPDGKIYFSVGDRGFNVITAEGKNLQAPLDQGRGAVFRMNPDGSEQALYAWGLRNPQELAFDNYGNLITGDNNSDGGDKARIVYLVEGGDSGWTYGYQYMEDAEYLRGPWNAEKMWEPYHKGQPAWIIPPLANETNGPSGLAFYPGLGLPERYNNHFFLSNYSFIATGTWILSFALEPEGAGFGLRNVHKFSSGDLFIDQGFGYDGKMYALTAGVFGGKRKILTLYGRDEQKDPRIAATKALLQAGISTLSSEELLALLGHVDQRIRLRAQFELAERNAIDELTALSRSASEEELARVHALWALGQIGARAFSDWQNFESFSGGNNELLAQAVKIAGEAKAVHLAGEVRHHILHNNARVSYFATMSAGKLVDDEAVDVIVDMLLRNANEDAFLRHAGVWALTAINDQTALERLAEHLSPEVRLASLLVARRQQSVRLAGFLSDEDPSLVVEAARAIHDLRVNTALPVLAAMADGDLPITSLDPQTSFALHRRVINANLLLGGENNALSLGRYAVRQSNPLAMRQLALQSLKEFVDPPLLDKVWGDHMALAARDASVVNETLDEFIPQLLAADSTSIADLAMETALAYNRLPLNAEQLSSLFNNPETSLTQGVAALDALHMKRNEADARYSEALASALNSEQAALRSRALQLLAESDPQSAAERAIKLVENASPAVALSERQAAIAVLGASGTESAQERLVKLLSDLSAGRLAADVQLDVIKAAEKSHDGAVQAALENYRQGIGANPLEQRRVAMLGGDAQNGRLVFENRGDCLRCHSVNKKGGIAGPALDGIASKFDTEYLYRALMDPAADMAQGFATVSLKLQDGTSMTGIMLNESSDLVRMQQDTGHGDVSAIDIPVDTITEREGPFSGMPAMGLVMSESDLRDVMAYLATLK